MYREAENVLVNGRKGIAYRIDENVPVLLADEAMEWPNESQGEN